MKYKYNIDKRKGTFNLDNSTEIDDYAYFIYLQELEELKKNNKWCVKFNQKRFSELVKLGINVNGIELDFYNIAIKLTRLEKLEKISLTNK